MLDALDRTQWSFARALSHIEGILAATHLRQDNNLNERTLAGMETVSQPVVSQPMAPPAGWQTEALEELLVALRDGEIFAHGRCSTTRNIPGYWPRPGQAWILHSGRHDLITPDQWREGWFQDSRLFSNSWEFIDIRLPRYMVIAVWPQPKTAGETSQAAADYSTPYMELLRQAVDEFRITGENQPKKECLVDWFKGKKVDGDPLSENLAGAMATLVRLPASQRGGARRAGV